MMIFQHGRHPNTRAENVIGTNIEKDAQCGCLMQSSCQESIQEIESSGKDPYPRRNPRTIVVVGRRGTVMKAEKGSHDANVTKKVGDVESNWYLLLLLLLLLGGSSNGSRSCSSSSHGMSVVENCLCFVRYLLQRR